jgi:hypothetical protein
MPSAYRVRRSFTPRLSGRGLRHGLYLGADRFRFTNPLHLTKAYVQPTLQVKILPVRCANETVLPPGSWTNEVVILHFTPSS